VAARRGNPPVLKRFGQHFLVDQAALRDIAAAVQPRAGETIVEIGPGRGALTDLLAETGNDVIAIEIDRALASQLRERYSGNARVRIIEADFLDTGLSEIVNRDFAVVGNVPYYITTPIIFRVLEPPLPRCAVFLVQREVAERIIASAGSSSYGALSVNVQAIAGTEIVRYVGAGSFRPPPKVESAVIRITPRQDPIVAGDEIRRLRTFVQGLFAMRRKQLGNSLRSVSSMDAAQSASVVESLGLDPKARPETLSPPELVALMRAIHNRA
jgi:16S rRNA (adenine1518-N6/adenine1519-N6)-dimethyltransferase